LVSTVGGESDWLIIGTIEVHDGRPVVCCRYVVTRRRHRDSVTRCAKQLAAGDAYESRPLCSRKQLRPSPRPMECVRLEGANGLVDGTVVLIMPPNRRSVVVADQYQIGIVARSQVRSERVLLRVCRHFEGGSEVKQGLRGGDAAWDA